MTTLLDQPLGIMGVADLPDDQLRILKKLEYAQFPYVEEKLLRDGKLRPSEIPEVVREFKRYMALIYLTRKSLAMTSPLVDEFWHQFILFTAPYSEFCKATVGFYVHHNPATSHTPPQRDALPNLTNAYRHYFGEMPRFWQRSDDCFASNGGCSDGPGCEGDAEISN